MLAGKIVAFACVTGAGALRLGVASFGAGLHQSTAATASPRAIGARMDMEELEFVIHADGRVEERVRGIKGANCQSVTEDINNELGEVYHTEATTEMFEQVVENTNEQGNENTMQTGPGSWGASGSASGSGDEW